MTAARWVRRFIYWLRFRAHQDDLREELAFHHELRANALERQGLSPEEARAAARRVMGDETSMREEARAVWLPLWLDAVIQDCGHAWRGLRRSPAFTAVVIGTIALCIGATTATYSIVRHLLLAPLPYPEGDRIVSLETPRPDGGLRLFAMSPALFRLYASRSRTLEDFAIAHSQKASIGEGAADDSAWVGLVTPSLLPMLRVRPILGRGFTPDDARPGAAAVALLSEDLWRSRFGGDPAIIGRVITVDSLPRTIVGVVPRGVDVPVQSKIPLDIWLPLDLDHYSQPWIDYALARLRPGIISSVASHELQAIRATLPDTGWLGGRRAVVLTAPEQVPPKQRHAVVILFAAAGGLLLIACADIAGLLLMRGWARRRELAIRRALGIGRGRLTCQLLTESLLLALPGGALGVLFAWLGLHIAVAVRPQGLELLDAASLDLTTILWTAAVTVGTGLLFGIGPAIFAWQQSLDGALRTGGGTRGESTRARTHAALVIGQVALSLIFLAAAGVVARSFVGLVLTPVGYQPEGLFEVSARRTAASEQIPAHHSTPAEQAAIAMALRKTLGTMPEVSEVAVGMLPLSNAGPGPTAVADSGGVRPVSIELTGLTYVSPEYFHVTQIPLVQGRGFDADPTVAAGEIVINETLARRLWPDRDAVGARLRDWEGEWLTVVGVAGDIQMPGSLAEYYRLQMYRAGTMSGPITWLVLRTRGDLSTLRPLLTHAVEHAGVGVTFRDVVAAESTLEYAFAAPRFALVLFGTFALVAVVLAAMSLFGNVAFAVARRTREIGVRVALGASPDTVGRLILGNGLRLAIVGCGLGLLGAYAAVRTLAAFLYDMKPPDLAIFGGAMLVLVVVALAASFIPMRRALRIDPMDVLRAD